MTPRGKIREVSRMLKAIHAQEDKDSARRKAEEVVRKLKELRLERASRVASEGYEEPLTYDFPSAHRWHARTNNPLERLNRKIRRRARVVESFPDGHAALMLVSARLRYLAGHKRGSQRHLSMRQEEFDE